MAARRRTARVVRPDPDAMFASKSKVRRTAFDFVLEELASLDPSTRYMFGGIAIYVEEKIVMMLADKERLGGDRGVWIATSKDHHPSLLGDLPSMRTITVFGSAVSSWQNLPADALSFEEDVLRACALIVAGDPRIGKVPVRRRKAVSPSPKSRKRSPARRSRSRRRPRARR